MSDQEWQCSGPRCKKTVPADGWRVLPPGWRWIHFRAGAFAVCETCTSPLEGGTCFEESESET